MRDRIGITDHALMHWRGRCRQWAPDRERAAKQLVERVVAASRMATPLEARCLSLFVNRARRWDAPTGSELGPARCVVSDETGVGFVLAFDDEGGRLVPVVTTAAPMDRVFRQCRGLPGSKLRKIEARTA